MNPRRLRAPAADGELLAEPPLDQAHRLAASNRARLDAWNAPIHGLPAHQLRRDAQSATLALAGISPNSLPHDAPWILTGHQPELFHPGVWAKNFAVGSLAHALGGFGLHLIVDNDLPKSAAIRVPARDPRSDRLRLVTVPFDSASPEVPYEDWTILDKTLFDSFADRVQSSLNELVTNPLIETFWPRVLSATTEPIRPGYQFAHARASIERQWGLELPHIPLSALCETPPFLRFAYHILTNAERFRTLHNAALADYRRLNRIRSKNHPVPDLGEFDGWIETPFWTWTRTDPRRRPLLVRQDHNTTTLRPLGQPPILNLLPPTTNGSPDLALQSLATLPKHGIRIRTRALTTTLFARLFLGDLFIHGIGGAKYDELGDAIISQFFQIQPPAFLVLSQTIWLGLPDFPEADSLLQRARALARDLLYNPDRHLPPYHDPQFDRIRERKLLWIQNVGSTHQDRVARWRALRECNRGLRPAVTQLIRQNEDRIAQLAREAAWNQVAHHRDLAFVLHNPARLRNAFSRIGPWSQLGIDTTI